MESLGKEFEKVLHDNLWNLYVRSPELSAVETGDGVTVTENEPRPARPDNTAERDAAEKRATEIIQDFGKGFISRSTATKVRDAAHRSIGGHDLTRGIGNIP